MAFNYSRVADADEHNTCDKCKKPGSLERPIVQLWTSGRHADQRNFIVLHLDCLRKIVNSVQLPTAPEQQQENAA